MSRSSKLLFTLSLTLFSACSESTITDVSNPVRPSAAVLDDTGNELELVKGQLNSRTKLVSKVIGPEGGMLVLPGWGKNGHFAFHSVIVPAGAVTEKLMFAMELSSDEYIEVDLNAYKLDAAGKPIAGTGHRGFSKPVYLTLSYANAEKPVPTGKVRIVYLNEQTGRAERVNSRALPMAQLVIGELRHFSRYTMAW